MQEHIAEFTGVNEDFEIIFNAAGAENMNRAKVSYQSIPTNSLSGSLQYKKKTLAGRAGQAAQLHQA